MIRTASVYEACRQLFRSYPLAVEDADDLGTCRSMVLTVVDGGAAESYVLTEGWRDEAPVYSLGLWPKGHVVDIDVHGSGAVPCAFATAVMCGIPLPRHGSIFGWAWGDAFTALVVIYTEFAPDRPLPRWTVMPVVGLAEPQWPPFTGSRLFGPWFWEHYRAGRLVPLDGLIAESHGTVFWVNTQAIMGADSCAVARDLTSLDGHTLRRGRYVYSGALKAGCPVPSLTTLLADASKTDLAPRFR